MKRKNIIGDRKASNTTFNYKQGVWSLIRTSLRLKNENSLYVQNIGISVNQWRSLKNCCMGTFKIKRGNNFINSF